MKAPDVITIDFETKAIEGRPKYPPEPVGVSIKWPKDRSPKYYAWGHPTGNNCDKAEARRRLSEAYASGLPLLFHNAKFDVDVADVHLGCKIPSWEKIHDTMFLLFLDDPHAASFALKPSADRLLGMAPDEQEAVRNWLIEKKIVRANDRKWGAHICEAPGDLVGKYAQGDVIRTEKLFKLLYPRVMAEGMGAAYDRERELMPILLENERGGVRADLNMMWEDLALYEKAMASADAWLRKRLGSKDLNVDSDDELAALLDAQGIVTDWALTATGKKSTAKKNLTPDMFSDQRVAQVLGYRNRLSTCLGTFMRPWIEMASSSGGMIFTNWNQVRQSRGASDSMGGARTGRLSSNPNFQNIPKDFYDKDDGYAHPKFLKSLPELPLMRRYILPDKGGVFLHRDYSQQELRILAHFEDGSLLQEYNENPRLDVHDYVRDAIQSVTGQRLERRAVKVLNFGIIYGMGLAKLAVGTHTSVEEAKAIKNAHRKGVPGVANLEKEIKVLGQNDQPIVTWGGRVYHVEPPRVINGVERTFEYKLLNYLIQGSAADCSKQAIINYNKLKKDGRFLVSVHDEMNISVPKKAAKSEMKLLREAMESVAFDLPMLSDGKIGDNWGSLTKYKE
jgi:DNA polymerase-1